MSNIEKCPRCGATSPVVQDGVCGGCAPPNIEKCTLFNSGSYAVIKSKIDGFLETGKPFKDVQLILPISGSSRRFQYRGVSIREWYNLNGHVRYDAVVELL